jgi:hypothetical protein
MSSRLSHTSTKLPNLKRLAASVAAGSVSKKSTVADSVQYLRAHTVDLQQWQGLDDLVDEAVISEPSAAIAKAAAHHLSVIRDELARQLWSRQIFVGVSVLEELLLRTAAAGESDPILATLEHIRDSELSRPGMIVLPLHSFGILAAGLLPLFLGTRAYLINKRSGFAVTPQTNDLHRTVGFLQEAGRSIGVQKQIDPELIRHWRMSRNATWLERNPLLIGAVTSIAGYYYENEFLLLGRLRAITSALVMLATLQPRQEDRRARYFSSRQIDNFETRDIRHYLVLSSTRAKYMTGQAVPIHRRRQVDELSDLSVDINLRYWDRYDPIANKIYESVDALYAGYLKYSIGSRDAVGLGRVYRKLFEAVVYFRRSHMGDGEGYSAILSLATAFEMLLTDSYAPNVGLRLRRRTELLLRGIRGTRRYQQAVDDLYHARNRAIHAGIAESLDLGNARRAFVLDFVSLMPRVPQLTGAEEAPIATLTCDV